MLRRINSDVKQLKSRRKKSVQDVFRYCLRGVSRLPGLVYTVALICSIAVWACGGTPKEVAETYLAELKTGHYLRCYRLLAREDRETQSFQEFVQNIPLSPDTDRSWFEAIESKTEYVLDSDARVHGRTAILPVKVTTVDLNVWERSLVARFGFSHAPIEAQRSLERNDFPRITYRDQFVMVKEFNRWRVYADLASYSTFHDLHRQALVLYHEHQLDRAVTLYRSLLSKVRSHMATGSGALEFKYARELSLIQKASADAEAARRYLTKIRLTNVRRAMAEDGRTAIFGEVINTGERSIDEIRVAVLYCSASGECREPIYSEEHNIVSNPLSFSGFAAPPRPLQPGEIRTFGFHLTAPTWVQERSDPKLKVTSLIFAFWAPSPLERR